VRKSSMATFRITWFGVQVRFSESETKTLIQSAAEAALLDAFIGDVFPAAIPLSVIEGGILTIDIGAIQTCDSARHNGVLITILWIGVPWCTGL
jgi:hypothetical protein